MEAKRNKTMGVSRFLVNLVMFLLILAAADFAVGHLLKKYYYSQQSGLDARTIYAVDQAKEELVVLGSSRASHHYVPDIIGKELRMSAYNAGREGNFILYHNAVLQCMVSRYRPKIVILDILNKEFSVNPDSYDRLATLMPFYRNHPAIRPIINLRGPFEPVKNLSAIYPFNSKLQAIAVGNMEFNKNRKQDYMGFIPLERTMNRAPQTEIVDSAYAIDTVKVNMYKALISTCKNNNIQLFVVCSPYYDPLAGEDPSIRIAREIAAEQAVLFWNFSSEKEFLGKAAIFDDKAHLNKGGAEIYSKMIADRILANEINVSAKR